MSDTFVATAALALRQQTWPRRLGTSVALAGLAYLLTGSAVGQATPSQPAVELDAFYTSEQAEFGERAYGTSCIGCHGDAMVEMFSEYSDASRFFGFISGSMPAESPGSLPNSDYLAIIAYLMQEMGYPAGDVPLVNNREILTGITPKASQEALGFVIEAPQP